MNLGIKIKQKRTLLQLTQEELANRCELTKGYISLLEHDKTSPSIETLTHILDVLGTSLSEFFSDDTEKKMVFTEEEQYEKDFSGYKQIWLVPTSQEQSMEPLLIEISPKEQTTIDMPHSGEEFGYVIDGEVTIVHGKTKQICKKGEAFYYITNTSHYLINHGQKIAKIIWVSCPPNF